MQEKDIINISINDPCYPVEFTSLSVAINEFWISGNKRLLEASDHPRVGIVGARKPTTYGREVAYTMARACANAGITVVSGLAFGIDAAAHRGALEAKGKTIAVLPSSLNKIYPATHRSLAEQVIANEGLLLSEYTRIEWPLRHYFILRNRLIAALSDVVVSVEGTIKSGSRHTFDEAVYLNKTVAAVPGPITSPVSELPNSLIRDGAHPICNTSDLLSLLGVNETLMKRQQRPENRYEEVILNALSRQHLNTNELLKHTNLEVSIFNTHLTMLEIKGAIHQNNVNKWEIS